MATSRKFSASKCAVMEYEGLMQQQIRSVIENAEDTEAKLSVNMQKFKNEVDSVGSLLMAENDRLTEIRDELQKKVDTMRSRIESRLKELTSRDDSQS